MMISIRKTIGIAVMLLSAQLSFSASAPVSALPLPEKRDELFVKAGLLEAISKLDALDKDTLYLSAQQLSSVELMKRYPQISRDSLDKLRCLVSFSQSKCI